MSNAGGLTSEAGRALARARWGRTRLIGLVHELHRRSAELGDEELAELQAVLAERLDPTKESNRCH